MKSGCWGCPRSESSEGSVSHHPVESPCKCLWIEVVSGSGTGVVSPMEQQPSPCVSGRAVTSSVEIWFPFVERSSWGGSSVQGLQSCKCQPGVLCKETKSLGLNMATLMGEGLQVPLRNRYRKCPSFSLYPAQVTGKLLPTPGRAKVEGNLETHLGC